MKREIYWFVKRMIVCQSIRWMDWWKERLELERTKDGKHGKHWLLVDGKWDKRLVVWVTIYHNLRRYIDDDMDVEHNLDQCPCKRRILFLFVHSSLHWLSLSTNRHQSNLFEDLEQVKSIVVRFPFSRPFDG